ncbi:MAG: ribokinase [Nostocoides sp.]
MPPPPNPIADRSATSRTTGSVVVLGSLNVDLVARVERHPRPGETVRASGLVRYAGGKGGNQAVAAAAAGAAVRMIGAVGSDQEGAAYLARLSRLGIDVSGVAVVAGPTGLALITVDDDGENVIVVSAGANGAVDDLAMSSLGDIGPGDVLLVQLEIPVAIVAAAVRYAAGRGARVVLNIAPYAALPTDVLALADPVVANEHEWAAVVDVGAIPGSLVVTFGANGATWDGLIRPAVPVPAADLVDTTGAGDAFCGALAAALAAGADRQEALERALAAGTAAVRHMGGQPDPDLP